MLLIAAVVLCSLTQRRAEGLSPVRLLMMPEIKYECMLPPAPHQPDVRIHTPMTHGQIPSDETLRRLPGWKYIAFTQTVRLSLAVILQDTHTAAIQEGGFIGHNFVLVGTPLNYSCVPPRSCLDTTTFRMSITSRGRHCPVLRCLLFSVSGRLTVHWCGVTWKHWTWKQWSQKLQNNCVKQQRAANCHEISHALLTDPGVAHVVWTL